MMNIRIIAFPVLFSFLFCPSIFSQGLIGLKHYSTEEGLSQNNVQDILQDEDGYIWLATWNGLERYDGYTFRNYKTYPDDKVKFKYNRLKGFIKGYYKTLWCHTYDDKVYLFDMQKECFKDVFSYHPDIKECGNADKMISIGNGIIWITSRTGDLWRIDERNYKEENGISFIPSGTYPVQGNYIYDIKTDYLGREWIFTNRGCFIYKKTESCESREFRYVIKYGKNLFMCSPDGFFAVSSPESGFDYIPLKYNVSYIFGMYKLPDREIAILTGRGIIIYNITDEHFRYLRIPEKHEDIHPYYFCRAGSGDFWMINGNSNIIRCDGNAGKMEFINYPQSKKLKMEQFIHEDEYGNIWVLPHNGELSYYNKENNSFERAYYYEDGVRKYYKASGRGFMTDSHKNMWLCCEPGIDKLTFLNGAFDYLSTNHKSEIRGLFSDSRGRLWVADKTGKISVYDRSRNYCGNLARNGRLVKNKDVVFGANIYCFFEDEKKNIWMGSRQKGLYVAGPVNNYYRILHFEYDKGNLNSVSSNSIYSICKDIKGRIWIGTYGGGINLVSGNLPDFNFINRNNKLKSYPQNQCEKIRNLCCSSGGIMLVGSNDGLLTFSVNFDKPEEIKFYQNICDSKRVNSLSNNDVMYVFESSKKQIYALTYTGGVNKVISTSLLHDTIEFSHLNMRNGLPSDMAYSILEDNNGALWISFENYISKYDPERGKIDTYDHFNFHSKLLISQAPMVMNRKLEMYVSNNDGVLYLDLKNLKKNNFVPGIVFTGVNTYKSTFSVDIAQIDNALVLNKEERNVMIYFAALDFTGEGNIKYAYRLKNINDKWSYTNNSHYASFANLPAGDWEFEVKSTNGDGVWTSNVTNLFIHVLPTFWETGWAWVLYSFIAIVLIFLISGVLTYIFSLKKEVDFEKHISNLKLSFFTDISHELRNSLTLIYSPIEEVNNEEVLSKEGRENMVIAKRNTDRMLRLINQLLDFRKISNNKMKLYIEQIDVVSLFKRTYLNFENLANEKSIKFHFECPKDNILIYTDSDKLEKVLFNLLSNAFKYTPKGKDIYLKAELNVDKFNFSVRDEGSGIDLRKTDVLFKRFETLGRTDSNVSTGIGLSLVKELVYLLHGSITLNSVHGRWIEFSVSIPASYEDFESDDNVEFIMKDGLAEGSQVDENICAGDAEIKDLTILIVEDNKELRHFIVKILHKQYNIIEAEDGKSGLEKVMSDFPDIILSDVMMPEMDGIELLNAVKNNHDISHTPFVLLSAKTSVEDRIKGIEYGADDYIIKPFSSEYLKARIVSLVKQRRTLRDYYLGEKLSGVDNDGKEDIILDELSPSAPQITHFYDEFIKKIIFSVEKGMQDPDFKIEDLADNMGMSRTVFYRKVKAILGVSPIDFVKNMRIKRAVQLLDSGEYSVSDVAYMSGFSSPQYFSRVFKAEMHCTPTKYKRIRD